MKTLFAILMVAGSLDTTAASLAVQVSGVTNTRAVLTYTAPDGNPCTVEVSENATYSPLVHDVDSTLFTGANSDAQISGISNGTARIVVIGARSPTASLSRVRRVMGACKPICAPRVRPAPRVQLEPRVQRERQAVRAQAAQGIWPRPLRRWPSAQGQRHSLRKPGWHTAPGCVDGRRRRRMAPSP